MEEKWWETHGSEQSIENQASTDPRTEMSWIRRFVDKGDDPPLLFFLLIVCIFVGSGHLLTNMHNDKFEENVGVIIDKRPDWQLVEYEWCNSEGYDCYSTTELHCFADLLVQHNVDGVNHTSIVNDWFVYSERDHSNAKQSCEEFVLNNILEPGSKVSFFFDKEDPSVGYKEVPHPGSWMLYISWFGMFMSILWVIMAILYILKRCFPRVFSSY